ncbi:hypothetical protein GCM10020001_104120 [Nonomuraea salmonea]
MLTPARAAIPSTVVLAYPCSAHNTRAAWSVERTKRKRSSPPSRRPETGGSASWEAASPRQCLALGLVDEVQLHILPILLGEDVSLFAGLGKRIDLERVETSAFAGETRLRCRVRS